MLHSQPKLHSQGSNLTVWFEFRHQSPQPWFNLLTVGKVIMSTFPFRKLSHVIRPYTISPRRSPLLTLLQLPPSGRKSENIWGNKYYVKESYGQTSTFRGENGARNVYILTEAASDHGFLNLEERRAPARKKKMITILWYNERVWYLYICIKNQEREGGLVLASGTIHQVENISPVPPFNGFYNPPGS